MVYGNTRNGLVQSRLDIWLASAHMRYDLNNVHVQIKPGIKSDQSIIKIIFEISEVIAETFCISDSYKIHNHLRSSCTTSTSAITNTT